MRVYELAKELGLSSKDLVVVLKGAGFSVSSHMSVLEGQDVAKARTAATTGKAPATQVQALSNKKAEKAKVVATPSAPSREQEIIKKTTPTSNAKKVDMTNSVKTTRPTSDATNAPLKKTIPLSHHEPESKKKHHEVAKASIEAEAIDTIDDLPLKAVPSTILDEQMLEKLSNTPIVINAKGQEKFTRIFAEKRRPTGGRRRRRRSFNKPMQEQAAPPKVVTEYEVTGPMHVGDLANALNKPASDVILNLLKRGMACNINHVIQPDMIKVIVEQYGIKALFPIKQDAAKNLEENTMATRLKKTSTTGTMRWPIVVVMGHVDHGKTTLLDYIRKKNVAGSEKGGITQHLGAYEVAAKGGHVVFLDTPGHEAFSYIRRQGSKVTDIAILVVAADDGIKPQTIEAIKHAKDAEVPIIVAINKIDKVKSSTAVDTIKRQLSQYDLMTEDWGGQVICVPISAKTGEGVEHLLEMILLQAEMMELKASAELPAKVFILESRVEKGFGPVATGIVVDGTLKQGDFFVCGKATGKVRLLVDSYDKRLTKAGPSVPVKIVGFNNLEDIGEWLTVVTSQEFSKYKDNPANYDDQKNPIDEAKDVLQQFNNTGVVGEKQQRSLNLILKTDTRGSKEALTGLIEKLAKDNKEINCPIRVIMTGIGDISEGDVELAMHTGSYVIGLHVKAEKNAQALAKDKHVALIQHDIIYHLVEYLQGELNKRREVKITWDKVAELVVRKVFDIKGLGVIAGCYVREGVVAKGNKVICMRGGKAIGEGKIASLQRDKKTVKEVHTGYECGFICDTYTDWIEDDTVVVMQEVKTKPV